MKIDNFLKLNWVSTMKQTLSGKNWIWGGFGIGIITPQTHISKARPSTFQNPFEKATFSYTKCQDFTLLHSFTKSTQFSNPKPNLH